MFIEPPPKKPRGPLAILGSFGVLGATIARVRLHGDSMEFCIEAVEKLVLGVPVLVSLRGVCFPGTPRV